MQQADNSQTATNSSAVGKDPSLSGSTEIVQAFALAGSMMKGGGLSHFDTQLAALCLQNSPYASQTAAFTSSVQQSSEAICLGSDGKAYVTIDAIAKDGDGAHLLADLQAIGLQQGASFGSVASGLIAIDQLGMLSSLDNLRFASESGISSLAGLVTTQADHAERADTARATYGVDGSGLKIGILSDSFNTRANPITNMATDIANGDLPSATTILQDSSGGTDEGRGMAQLVHDIAPGAAIAFATGNGGQANFANNILALAAAGANVIVDDLIYFAELSYQNGPIAQAVESVVNAGVAYFSSAGNNGHEGLVQNWTTGATVTLGGFSETLMRFAPGQDYLPVVLGSREFFVLQWDQPGASAGGPGSASDVDLFLTDITGNTVYAQAIADNIGADPVEVMSISGGAGGTYYLRVGLFSGPAPTEIRLIALGNGASVDLGTTVGNFNDGTLYGHAAAPGAVAVAAAYFGNTPAYGVNPPTLESFSSYGPTRFWYTDSGVRLGAPTTAQTPQITAVDGGDTTFFGGDNSDAGTFPNFFGTSAAAPDAAAVAVLMKQANLALNPSDIALLLQDSAIDMDNPQTAGFDVGQDRASGSGLIQADLAVGYARTLVINNASNLVLYGTHLSDTITAGPGNNTIQSGDGNDSLDGGAGADAMIGGTGNDTYAVDNGGDQVVESSNEGTDTVNASISFALGVNVENLMLTGTANINGTGNSGNNSITGNAGNNVLDGGGGNDTLDAGAGADTMAGGAGNDVYYVDNGGDAVIENPNEGNDTVNTSIHYRLTANAENLVLQGSADLQSYGNAQVNVLTGNSGSNILDGDVGADTMVGGAGNDVYYVDNGGDQVIENANEGNDLVFSTTHLRLTANVENLILQGSADLQGYGNSLANTIIGNGGSNLLDGDVGVDAMYGGAGNDVYYVDNAGDVAIENPGEGNDAVFSTAHFRLSANVETLVLQGSADLQGYGNSLANTLYGNSGSNLLDGDAGADTMIGGAGNDVYYVDNGGDAVMENANEGNDAVFASIHYRLTANVETLVLQGSADLQGYGNGLANALFGNTGNNILDGDTGADTMVGGAGDDAYFVDDAGDGVIENANAGLDTIFSTVSHTLEANVEQLVLQGSGNLAGTGNALNNNIYGNSGDNTLDGGAGVDVLQGNTGNDIFVFDVGQANDDMVLDFNGLGAATGDSLRFVGYGAGTTFTNIDAAHWQINYNSGNSHEVIAFMNSAAIDATDWQFA